MTKHIVAFRNFANAPRSPYRPQYQTKLKLIVMFEARSWHRIDIYLDTNVLDEPAAFTVKAAWCQRP